jgi:hypothetical protein
MDLLPGARNVMAYGAAGRGDEVLITTDTLTPPLVAQALVVAATEVGARPVVVVKELAGLHWRRGVEPPRTYRQAVYQADLEIEVLPMEAQAYPRLQETAMIEHGSRKVCMFAFSEADLASPFALFPYDVMHLMTRKIFDQWTRGALTPGTPRKTIRVTAANGTDLTATYDPRYVVHTGFLFPRLRPGQWNAFAGATVGIELFDDARGVIAFDGLHGEEEYKALPPVGSDVVFPLSEPVRWVFDGKYARIEGGREAAVMRRIVERAGTKHATILCEIALGINPKAPLASHPTRHAGVTHYAIGSTRGRTPTPDLEDAPVHTHGHIYKATVEVDGEPCIVDGRLLALDDAAIRAAAAVHGDPDEILEEAV